MSEIVYIKDIPEFDGEYAIDEYGNVYGNRVKFKNRSGYRRPRRLKQQLRGDYRVVHLRQKCYRVHDLVAKTFLGGKDGMWVDHVDRNKLNNHVSNIRLVTPKQNTHNSKPCKGRKYKGVFARKTKNPSWIAQLTIGKKTHFLGTYYTPEDAARAFDKAAFEYQGEHAYLNFPYDYKEA